MRRLTDALRRAGTGALNLVYPRGITCHLCGIDLDAPGVLCADCAGKLPPAGANGTRCSGCGRTYEGREPLCRKCGQYGPVSDGGFAAHDYTDAARSLLVAFKFEDRTSCRELFAHGMIRAVRDGGIAGEIDCVVPVPMHWLRKLNRGYNQSALLAAWVAESLGKPVMRGVLARPVYTRELSRTQGGAIGRMESAYISYRPGRGSLAGKRVLLVDDILTTGSTLRACVAILRGMGAEKVYTVVAAAVPE